MGAYFVGLFYMNGGRRGWEGVNVAMVVLALCLINCILLIELCCKIRFSVYLGGPIKKWSSCGIRLHPRLLLLHSPFAPFCAISCLARYNHLIKGI